MKKLLLIIISALTLIVIPTTVSAQGIMGNWAGSPSSSIDQTAIQEQQEEEQTGKNLLSQLQSKATTCKKLTNDNFEKIGEYFMGQAIGDTSRHIQMNNMMKSMMGKQGEEQMHIAWGKRGSNCDTNASYPQNGIGFTPMLWMMGGGGNPMMGYGGWGNMMGWGGFGLGWIFMVIFWALIILGVVALIRYLTGSRYHSEDKGKTPLDILKERFAKGEIDKKEFEEMKKDVI
ncbi:hypothetical protein C4559_00840 [Candidatus Microgenomates bacterium]|nr:MAG: hypothetical protein C4559_00840 [Candidatus Microgenomates bacterium]